MMSLGSRRPVVLLGLAAGVLGPAAAAAQDPEALELARRSAARITVHRLGGAEAGMGSAVVIDGAGFLLTVAPMVDDSILVRSGASSQRVTSRVQNLVVETFGEGDGDRGAAGRVVAIDSDRGIALLRADVGAGAVSAPLATSDPFVGQEVWVLGFPVTGDEAGAVATAGRAEPRRDFSVYSGRVTALRRDADDRLTMFQLDAAINHGVGGGGVFTSDGELLGVVAGKLPGASRLGFAIAPGVISAFLHRCTYDVHFQPPRISEDVPVLYVALQPGMFDFDGCTGSVELVIGDTTAVQAPLSATTAGHAIARVDLPSMRTMPEVPDHYLVNLSVRRGEAPPWEMRYRIPVQVPEDVRQAEEEADQEAARERSSPLGAGTLTESAKHRAGGAGKGLGDVARDTEIKKSGDGSVVVDSRTVIEHSRYDLDRPEYSRLPGHRLKVFAAEYDYWEATWLEATRALEKAHAPKSRFSSGADTFLEAYRKTTRARREMMTALFVVKEVRLRRLEDGTWVVCEDDQCTPGVAVARVE